MASVNIFVNDRNIFVNDRSICSVEHVKTSTHLLHSVKALKRALPTSFCFQREPCRQEGKHCWNLLLLHPAEQLLKAAMAATACLLPQQLCCWLQCQQLQQICCECQLPLR